MAEFRPSFKKVEGSISISDIQTNNIVLAIGSVQNVPQATLTTIVTLPANGIKYITKIMCSGEDNAKWDVYVNNVRQFTLRTTNRSVDFNFQTPLKVFATTVVDVKCEHNGSGTTADFEATILGYQSIADTTAPAAISDLGAS